MADRTLLIPGTQATSLRDLSGTVIFNAVRVGLGLDRNEMGGRPVTEWARLLSVETPVGQWAPSRTSLEPGTEIVRDTVVGSPYDRMLSFAEPWPYDWRLDMRHNARQLLDWMARNRPENGRFNLIGHSHGGHVIVLASKLCSEPNAFSRLVARVVLVGAPLAGTMRATEALLWGSEGLGRRRAQVARQMALTWPSLYQMLPSWPAVERKKGEPLGDEVQFLQPGGWPGAFGDGVQPDLLARARETAALLRDPLVRFGPGTMSLSFLGKRQMTPVALRRRGDTLPEDRGAMRNEQGDGLVPYRKTLEWGGIAFGDQVVALTGKPNVHALLCNDLEVLEMTQRFLRAEAPPVPPAAAGPLSVCLALLALFALLTVHPAAAQAASFRTQLGWVAGHVAGATVGVETRVPLGAKPPLPLPGRPGSGPIEAATRPWTLTGMFTAGVNFSPPQRDGGANAVEGLGYAHAGAMYRTGGSFPSAVGGVVALYFPVGAVGPALIVEASDLFTVQGGALRTAGGWMGHAGLSVSVRFLNDLF